MLQNIYNGLDLSGFSHLQNFFLIIEFNFILLRFPGRPYLIYPAHRL